MLCLGGRPFCGNFVPALVVAAAAMTTAPLRAHEGDDQYALAAAHYSQRRWKLAAEAFESFLERFPDHPRATTAWFFWGETLMELGRHDAAATRFQAYLERDPDGRYARQARFRAGEAAFLDGDYQRARQRLEAFEQLYPDDPLSAYALAYLGQIALEERRYEQAEAWFRRTLDRFPQAKHQDRSRYGLACALEKLGKRAEAERLFLAVAAKTTSPLADDAQYRLGALLYAQGRFAEALEVLDAFQTRLATSPRRSAARLGQGWALFKLGRLEEAEEAFRSVADDARVGIEARFWLGLAQKARADWETAADTLLAAAADAAEHKLLPAIRLHAGYALLRAGDPARATAQFDQVLGVSGPGDPYREDALRGKLEAALVSGDHAAVDGLADQFSCQFPRSPRLADVQRLLAHSLVQRHQYARAAEILEPLAADPRAADAETHYLLALAYRGLRRHDEALAQLSPLLDNPQSPLHAEAQLVQAFLLIDRRRYAEAIGPLEGYLARHRAGTKVAEALGQLAVCYARAGRLEQAKKTYAQLLEQAGRGELVPAAAAQLAEAATEGNDLSWATELYGWLAEHTSGQRQADGLAGLGWSQLKSGDLEAAAATFQKLLEEYPQSPRAAEAALARGRLLERLGRHQEALALYNRVLDQFPGTPEYRQALLAAATLYDQRGEDQRAAGVYQQWMEAYPDAPGADAVLYRWAWALYDMGRTDEADAVFARLCGQFPQSRYWADAMYRRAVHALQGADYAQAGAHARAVLERSPDEPLRQGAWFLLGQSAAAEGRWEEAREAFEAVLELQPDPATGRRAEYWIAEAAFQLGHLAEAASRLEKLAQEVDKDSPPWAPLILLRRAQVLAQQDQWQRASEIASQIEPRFPDFPQQYEADYIIGRYLATQADFEGARAHYRKVWQSPAGGKTETAAMARFMAAESFFHQKRFDQALRQYLAVEILYAYPQWQAAAALQAGKCYERLGEWNEAARQYTRVLEAYTDTPYADEARRRLPIAQQRTAQQRTAQQRTAQQRTAQ